MNIIRNIIKSWGLLSIILVIFKLTNFIDWSWWWIMSPIWIPVIIIIVVFLLIPEYPAKTF